MDTGASFIPEKHNLSFKHLHYAKNGFYEIFLFDASLYFLSNLIII